MIQPYRACGEKAEADHVKVRHVGISLTCCVLQGAMLAFTYLRVLSESLGI